MADSELNIKITAEDKASPAIQKTTKSLDQLEKEMTDLIRKNEQVLGGMENLSAGMGRDMVSAAGQAAHALTGLGGSAAKVTSELGLMIGTGGLAGLSVALVTAVMNVDEITSSIGDWALGLTNVRDEYDKMQPKLEEHVKALKEIHNQIELLDLAGSARAAGKVIQQVAGQQDLELRLQTLKAARAELERAAEADRARRQTEAARSLQAIKTGVVPTVEISPEFRESLKATADQITETEQKLELMRSTTALLNKALSIEEAEEGKKRLEELGREAEKFEKKVEAIDRALSRQFERPRGELPTPPVPIVGPTILSPEQIRRMQEGITEGLQDAAFKGIQTNRKATDEIFDYYTDQGIKSQRKIEDMREDAWREQKQQYERMIDGIRDGAGRVFDAMLTKGESVFASLANFAQGVLQTMLRNVFQNAVQMLATGTAAGQRMLGILGGGGGAGGGGAGAIATGSMATMAAFPGFGGLFGRGGEATGGMGPHLGMAAKGSFATGAAGSALIAGGALAGQMLAMDAFRRGSAIEGLAGGAMAGASIGTMIAPGIGTAIGAGVGAIAGLVTGLFGGGAQRRAEEAAKRAAMIEAQQFAAPETISRFGVWGAPGEFAVEPDLMGQIRGIGRQPQVNNYIEVQLIDAKHAREAGEVIANVVSERIMTGGSLLADNIAWAAGAP